VLEPRPTAGQSQAHPRSRSHPVRKFMPERIDPQSPREDNPHPRKEITTTFTVTFLDIFTILSLFIHRSELSPSTSCLHSATEGPGRLSDGDHSLKRLIAVTRVPEGASPRILVSPVALLRSVKVETSFCNTRLLHLSRSAYLLPQAGFTTTTSTFARAEVFPS
jgi:hypothetical protein